MTVSPGDVPAQNLGNGSPFDAIRRTDEHGGADYWSARELMPLLGYGADWRNFDAAVQRAKISAANSGTDVTSLFGDVTENSGGRPRADYRLARFAAYLVALNGDPRKAEIAAAQTYFAVRTREAETAPAFDPKLSRLDILKLAMQAEEEKAVLEAALESAAPAIEHYDRYVSEDDVITVKDWAALFGLSEPKGRALLAAPRLRKIENAVQVYVMGGLCGNVTEHQNEALRDLIAIARTDGDRS